MNRRFGLTAAILLLHVVLLAASDEKPADGAGWVRLPLSDYDRLVKSARQPLEKAPLDAAFTATTFILEAEGASARLHTTLEIASLSDKPQTLPLPDLGILYAVDPSREGATVATAESGEIQLHLPHRGRFLVRLHSVPSREAHGGQVQITWKVPDAPSNRFSAALPPGHESVTLAGGSVSVAAGRSGPVRVTGTLRRGETARLAYSVAEARAPEEKLLASASESRLYRLGEKSLGIASRLRIEVLRGTLRAFTVEAPAGLAVMSAWASGNTVTSFERDPEKPGRLVLVLERGISGGATEVFFLLEQPLRAETGVVALPEIGLPDFLRGEIAVAVTSPRPVVLDEARGRRDGYERIDETDLPPELREMADATVLLALRRIGSAPPALAVHIASFPNAAGLAGVIDRAKVLTVAARDGSRVDRWQLELQTRESIVRIPLPAGATLWSLQVDGKPARPLTEQGQLLVSLGRGEKSGRTRRVEIVLAIPGDLALPKHGTAHVAMPKLPFPVTHAEWDLLLPETAQYRYGGGTVSPAPAPLEAGSYAFATSSVGANAAGNVYVLDGVEASAGLRGSGRLSGKVVEQHGRGPLPGVTVTLNGNGYRRAATTNASGDFLFSDVPAGTFQLRGELSGFSTMTRTVALPEGGNLGADLDLGLASVQAEVTVRGDVPMLESLKVAGSASTANDSAKGSGARKAAALEAQRQVLSDEERNSLQRTSEAGVAAIAVELPTEGKRLHFEGSLLIDVAAALEIQVRPVKRGWLW